MAFHSFPLTGVMITALVLSAPVSARDSLGIFSAWGAFRDAEMPRCYAIAKPMPSGQRSDRAAYASVGSWPRRALRNQLHFRLSRDIGKDARIRLSIGDKRFDLIGSRGNAWAVNRAMDAAIVAAMRSATRMTIRSRGANRRRFSNTYALAGAATAMDAATIGCS